LDVFRRICCFICPCALGGHPLFASFKRFLDHTQRRTTVGRTPLHEWLARPRYLYLTTHNTHKRQTSMVSVRFEPTISEDERPQTNVLDRAATGSGARGLKCQNFAHVIVFVCIKFMILWNLWQRVTHDKDTLLDTAHDLRYIRYMYISGLLFPSIFR
jgi:hypothetical protein